MKFVNKAQCLQFLIKEYCAKFHSYDHQKFYEAWKAKKNITSATELTSEEIDEYINSFEAALDNNTP